MSTSYGELLKLQTEICQKSHGTDWIDDWEYICWAYLVGDRKMPLLSDHIDTRSPDSILHLFHRIKAIAESINGWCNDVTYFEMDRWLVLYEQWKIRYNSK